MNNKKRFFKITPGALQNVRDLSPGSPAMTENPIMNKASRIAAGVIGSYAALLGMAHGFFEVRQMNTPTNGIVINAIGPMCEAETTWHACFPAMTVAPIFLAAGILTLVAGLILLIWTTVFIQHKRGGLILLGLSVILLLVGGGFIPPMLGIAASLIGTRIHAPLSWWSKRLSGRFGGFLASLWPWPAVIYPVWIMVQVFLNVFATDFMLRTGFIPSLVSNILLILLVLSGFAADVIKQKE